MNEGKREEGLILKVGKKTKGKGVTKIKGTLMSSEVGIIKINEMGR